MNWYRIKTDDGKSDTYTHVGSSPDTPSVLVEKAARGEYIVLQSLLYNDRGDVKEWSEWDKSVVPTVYINPRTILSIMQFKGDPRTTPER